VSDFEGLAQTLVVRSSALDWKYCGDAGPREHDVRSIAQPSVRAAARRRNPSISFVPLTNFPPVRPAKIYFKKSIHFAIHFAIDKRLSIGYNGRRMVMSCLQVLWKNGWAILLSENHFSAKSKKTGTKPIYQIESIR
jgi:hypothetical protein